jgi:hypothetical protein
MLKMTLRNLLLALFLLLLVQTAFGQRVKRIVIVKIDGLPSYYVDRFVKERDPRTGRSMLPWIEHVFYKNGTRVTNFYTRGYSISGPAWGVLDTGQHMQIKGNVEYDRYTLYPYDYLNFFPYYLNYAFKQNADMPAAEILDQLGIPLISDVFPYERRYKSHQLYQRGNNWEVLAKGFLKLYPGNVSDFLDEWTIGLPFRKTTVNQNAHDIQRILAREENVDYMDYYDVSFDHVSHHNNDAFSRVNVLKEIDRVIGRFWTSLEASGRGPETALVLVSDHGFNSDEETYSQGFNIVRLLANKEGGAHHTITKRRLLLDYSIKGIYPLTPLIRTVSDDSLYLKGQSQDYPTALVDFDGNERSTIHLRNSDLNRLHILLQQIRSGLREPLLSAAADSVIGIIEKERKKWQRLVSDLREELAALQRAVENQNAAVARNPKKFTKEQIALGEDKQARREFAAAALNERMLADYRAYLGSVERLLSLTRHDLLARRFEIRDLIHPGAMGEHNSIHQLQNYVIGVGESGLVIGDDGLIDEQRSYQRVNYFDLLLRQRVRNNVQEKIGNRPVDFTVARIAADEIASALPGSEATDQDAVWLAGEGGKQALILTRIAPDGERSYRYLFIRDLVQHADGRLSFKLVPPDAGHPLRYFEDPELNTASTPRAEWLGRWHTERDWLRAVHRTLYSNALISVVEQTLRHPLPPVGPGSGEDDVLIRRFRQRQRDMSEPEIGILANNHWNFDVRGFNPGGNHGSFFRVSSNATFMIAGGDKTGIPRGLEVSEPYDSLSFAPTIFNLMGFVNDDGSPRDDIRKKGFRRMPGRMITEITSTDRSFGAR